MSANGTRMADGVEVWNSEIGKIPYIPYEYRFVFPLERAYWNSRAVHAFILPLLVLVDPAGLYMRNRKPFKLNGPLMVWNATLSLFSLCGTIRTGEELWNVMEKRGLHDTLCYTYGEWPPARVAPVDPRLLSDPSGIASLWNFLFIVSKGAELCDTLFIVLRKRPLIFLHWYHHFAVLIVTWHGAQWIISASRTFSFMNYAVHTPMFFYFAVTSAGIRPPRFCAMMVTILQNVQMIFGVLITLYIAKTRWLDGAFCHVTDNDLALCFFVYLTFGLLFSRFFIRAYLRPKLPEKEVKVD
ncbi:GNS1 SUR4 membrane protein domain containing protein [Aphelenchoides fujianensis]|nr:GNS1 SUR4 membrane protein domain containing protein [Aphelenchoides fujianensis]